MCNTRAAVPRHLMIRSGSQLEDEDKGDRDGSSLFACGGNWICTAPALVLVLASLGAQTLSRVRLSLVGPRNPARPPQVQPQMTPQTGARHAPSGSCVCLQGCARSASIDIGRPQSQTRERCQSYKRTSPSHPIFGPSFAAKAVSPIRDQYEDHNPYRPLHHPSIPRQHP